MTERTVIRDDVTLVCHDRGGDGPPLLLLHGLAGYGGEWDPLARHLGTRFRVVTVDQRGHGASTRRPADVSRAAHVADVAAVIGQLDLGPVTLLGQSYGAHAAMLAAAAHPELVERLVLVEAGPAATPVGTVADIGAWFASWPAPFATLSAAVEFLGGGPVGEAWAAGLEERADGRHPRFDPDIMVAALTDNTHRSWWAEWGRIACPTLLVLAQSTIIDAEQLDRMHRDRPDAVLASVPGTTHDLHLERPEALAELLEDFCAAGAPRH
ncbi:Pimeloyl-ACP methyl ester carboxylesterase [Streptomyces sp. TLI_053]|uniref:alpha/beta fold hydrolase n=1 Tax=Streptomyces sp. TLI_053 TaxID=1855352 RepID=UPI00087DC68C|nr:alpha/beta hydrolase [Streptomyces sp. TLI_053]SDT72362.1 Pimeloyl-ACP methyl ester carboxylesterase [Streptomyces sp. TLI_053]